MKQYYESEVLFQLMERDGLNIPSSVPPYEAEIKDYLINQVKQAYPKLTDYEAEWLLYNYTKHLPAEFPISSVSDVTEATFENVVPFAYQSAILKGLTKLVDENGQEFDSYFTIHDKMIIGKGINDANGNLVVSHNDVSTEEFLPLPQPPFIITGNSGWKKIVYYDSEKQFIGSIRHETDDVPVSSTPSNAKYCRFGYANTVKDNTFKLVNNDGSELDYPKLTIQSVKMPVLTTTGKNLFDGELEYGSFSWSNGAKTDSKTVIRNVNPIKVNTSKIYLTSTTGDIRDIQYVFQYDENMSFIGYKNNSNGQITLDSNTCYINIRTQSDGGSGYVLQPLDDYKIQIEEGSTATQYEPYKTNILTVNEDVTLRSNGDVCDELDLLTGKLTQRIDEDGEVLVQEVVKTVDLTTVNEKGETTYFMPLEETMNVLSSGEIIKPTFDMSVPIEATTQNLASFIDMEMEE